MIRLTGEIPLISLPSAESIKINCIYKSYSDIALFWVQDENRAVISLLDGNMIVLSLNTPDFEEMREFIEVIAPTSVFSDAETLRALGAEDFEEAEVMTAEVFEGEYIGDVSDELSSGEVYELLNVEGLSLPEYEYFAVDFCRRLNGGFLKYFAVRRNCAAVSISCDNYFLINGIASRKKGYGSIALNGIRYKNKGKIPIVCLKKELLGFYEKNGFTKLYKAGYWVRK